MKKLSLLILLGFFSCTQDTVIRVSDLKFPDPQRVFIKQNQIDTTFIFIPQEDGSELRFYKTYDENGNILFDSTDIRASIRYYYDSLGLLIKTEGRRGGGAWIDSLSYEFDRESMILRQKWSSNMEYRFFFDNNGRVQQSVMVDLSEQVIKERISYIYDGDLLQKSLIYSENESNPDIESDYYYSPKGILDSITLKTDTGHRQRWVYDSLGLLNAEWFSSNSETRFVHKRRM